jgi:hypothetical protein
MAVTYNKFGNIMKSRGNLGVVREMWMKSRDLYAKLAAKTKAADVQRPIDELPKWSFG